MVLGKFHIKLAGGIHTLEEVSERNAALLKQSESLSALESDISAVYGVNCGIGERYVSNRNPLIVVRYHVLGVRILNHHQSHLWLR